MEPLLAYHKLTHMHRTTCNDFIICVNFWFVQIRSLHELVKEVPCAGVKKHHLKRAIETYLNEKHPCHCRECQNNGLRVLDNDICKCVCKPGTKGQACEQGTPEDEQPGTEIVTLKLYRSGVFKLWFYRPPTHTSWWICTI